jgi:hypothetical protein
MENGREEYVPVATLSPDFISVIFPFSKGLKT